MQTFTQPEVKLKIGNFDNSICQVEEKSNNSKLGLGSKFYQKLFIVLFVSCAFLIFPEFPQDSETLCRKYHSSEACMVW